MLPGSCGERLLQVGDTLLVVTAIDRGHAVPVQAFRRATGEERQQQCRADPSID